MKQARRLNSLIVAGSLLLLLSSCYYLEPAVQRDPPLTAQDLLLEVTDLPAGWRTVWHVYKLEPRNVAGYEALVLEFRGPRLPEGQDGAGQTVYRFKNASLAASAYPRMQQDPMSFSDADDNRPHPAGWSYRSPLADDWRFACDGNGCGVMARYDEFISTFSTSMTTSSMTPQALEAVLRAIDRRMAEKLGGQGTATPTRTSR